MLRIGILLNSLTVPKWVSMCLDEISKNDFCKIELFVLNGAKIESKSSFNTILQRRFYKLDRWKNRKYDLLTPSVLIFPEQVHVMTVYPETTTHTDTFPRFDIEKIRGFNLDVILRFGFRILRGDILDAAKHGVWSFHHGDNHKYRGGPPCLWEVMRGEKTVGQVLQALDDELDGGGIIDRAWTLAHNVSIVKTQHQAFSKSPAILMRSLRRLHDRVLHAENNDHYDQPLYKAPTSFQFVKLFVRYVWRKLFNKRLKEKRLRWRLLYAKAGEKSLYKFKELIPPKGKFWADPFVLKWADRQHIFFEEYDHAKRKGHIEARTLIFSSCTLDEYGKAFNILEEPFHLSYPFPFHYRGNLFLTVDSGLGDLRVYRLDFNKKLIPIYTKKIDNPIHDPTIYCDGNLWWLFFSTTNDMLFLYYADDPISNKWQPHKFNPVVIDARGARPAGALFRAEGKLFRPAQDYTHEKRYALRIKEVVNLTTYDYFEKDAGSINPEWNDDVQGIHTMNRNSEYTVFDAMYFK